MSKLTRKYRRFSRGVTLLELMVSISILLGIIAMATGMFSATSRNQARLRAENVMKSQTTTALFRLASKLNQARMIMNNDTLGQAYLNAVSLTNAPPKMLAADLDTQLPTIRAEGSLSPEKSCTDPNNAANFFRSNTAGNALMFVRYIGKFSKFPSITTELDKRSLDIYEFKLIYLTDDRTNPRSWFIDGWYRNPPAMRRLRLIEWTSVKYVDYDQLSDYIADSTNSVRGQIRTDLNAAGLTTAWRRSGTNVTGGSRNVFYSVGSGGSAAATLSVTGSSTPTINQQSALSLLHFDQDIYTIAYNRQTNQSAARYFLIQNKVPLYYDDTPPDCNGASPAAGTTPSDTPTTSKNGFPGGFEVMVVGPPSGRSVLLRITTAALRGGKPFIDHADTITAYARDL